MRRGVKAGGSPGVAFPLERAKRALSNDLNGGCDMRGGKRTFAAAEYDLLNRLVGACSN